MEDIEVVREWKSNGDLNVMRLPAAVSNLAGNVKDVGLRTLLGSRSAADRKSARDMIRDRLLAGQMLETPLAEFYL